MKSSMISESNFFANYSSQYYKKINYIIYLVNASWNLVAMLMVQMASLKSGRKITHTLGIYMPCHKLIANPHIRDIHAVP